MEELLLFATDSLDYNIMLNTNPRIIQQNNHILPKMHILIFVDNIVEVKDCYSK